MALGSANIYKTGSEVALAAGFIVIAYLLQITILSNFVFQGTVCNLPLTITILWGYIFCSDWFEISTDELRASTASTVFIHQVASGSVSGLLIGAFVAALYSSILPIYPISFPIIGWITGYIKLPSLNQETLMCIPLVFLATVLAEVIMSWQLSILGRPDAITHLSQFVIPEALLNSLIAPFIYFPMRRWFEYNHSTPMDS